MSDYRERANERTNVGILTGTATADAAAKNSPQEEALEGHEQKESMQPSADSRDPKIAPRESIRGESVLPVANFCWRCNGVSVVLIFEDVKGV